MFETCLYEEWMVWLKQREWEKDTRVLLPLFLTPSSSTISHLFPFNLGKITNLVCQNYTDMHIHTCACMCVCMPMYEMRKTNSSCLVPGIRAGHILCRAQCKLRMWSPLFRKQKRSAVKGTKIFFFLSSLMSLSHTHTSGVCYLLCNVILRKLKF